MKDNCQPTFNKERRTGGGEEENLASLFKWKITVGDKVKGNKTDQIKMKKKKVKKAKIVDQCKESITPFITKLLLSKYQIKGKKYPKKMSHKEETSTSSCSGWRGPRTSPSEVPQTRIVKARKSKVCLDNVIVFHLLRYFHIC